MPLLKKVQKKNDLREITVIHYNHEKQPGEKTPQYFARESLRLNVQLMFQTQSLNKKKPNKPEIQNKMNLAKIRKTDGHVITCLVEHLRRKF